MAFREDVFNHCWHFIRGDLPIENFESWVYDTPELQSLFGEDFYMELISTDYVSSGAVYVLKQNLEDAIQGLVERNCYCHTLPNLADVGMGDHKHIFKSLDRQAKYGETFWWLWLAECNMCDQFWLVASEERINDVFIMKRLPSHEAQRVLNESIWPSDFNKFSTLLTIGKQRGHTVRFMNPVSRSLVRTVIDLAAENPDLNIEDISALLQIGLPQAEAIVEEAKKDKSAS